MKAMLALVKIHACGGLVTVWRRCDWESVLGALPPCGLSETLSQRLCYNLDTLCLPADLFLSVHASDTFFFLSLLMHTLLNSFI